MAKAMRKLSRDVYYGNGKNKVLFGNKGDMVEAENYGKLEDGMYLAQHKISIEKLIIKKEDIL